MKSQVIYTRKGSSVCINYLYDVEKWIIFFFILNICLCHFHSKNPPCNQSTKNTINYYISDFFSIKTSFIIHIMPLKFNLHRSLDCEDRNKAENIYKFIYLFAY